METTTAPASNRQPWSRRRLGELAAAALAGCLIFGIATATPARSTASLAYDAGALPFENASLPESINPGSSAFVSSPIPTSLPTGSNTNLPFAPTVAPSVAPTVAPSDVTSVASSVAPSVVSATTTTKGGTPNNSLVTTTTAVAPLAIGSEITMIGDSLMETATFALHARFGPEIVVDTQIGRQFTSGIERANALRYDGKLKPIVIIGLGTNGPFSEKQIEALITELGDRKTIAFVKVVVPRRWQKTVNEALDRAKERHPELLLIDWPARVADYKVRLQDGVHPTVRGARLYADLIATALPQTPTTPISVQNTALTAITAITTITRPTTPTATPTTTAIPAGQQ